MSRNALAALATLVLTVAGFKQLLFIPTAYAAMTQPGIA